MTHENSSHPAGGILMRLAKCRRGAVALEFATGFPIFLAMTYGLFEFSRVFWVQNTVQFAIEEAARSAIVDADVTEADIETAANGKAAGLDPTDLNIDVTFERDNSDPGTGPIEFINITGTYTFAPFIPIVIPFIGTDSSIDFQLLDYDIIASTRMPAVL